jgi:hypothetical protein
MVPEMVPLELIRSPPSGESTVYMMPAGSIADDVMEELRFDQAIVGAGVVVGSSSVIWMKVRLDPPVVPDATVNWTVVVLNTGLRMMPPETPAEDSVVA